MELSPQQAEAVEKIRDWYASPRDVFRLFGYAGTGKTTLATHIVEDLGLTGKALFAAFTGKASYVMRTKGATGAGTIHSLIYTPVERARALLDELRERRVEAQTTGNHTEVKDLDERIRREQVKLTTPGFVLKETSELEWAPLLVLDEVSMVDTTMAHDLLSFGVKILVLGDPAQLPPVGGSGYFINSEPDHLITEIHRQAAGSPVLRIATTVRTSDDRHFGVTGLDGDSGRIHHLPDDYLLGFGQVIVGRNRTRWNLIHRIRELQGLGGPIPQRGDKIIVIANNRESDVYNGQMLDVVQCAPEQNVPDVLNLLAIDDEGDQRLLQVWACGFTDQDGERLAKQNGRSRIVAATFGQAITAHKAQGSQWETVLVVDESSTVGWATRRDYQRDNPYNLTGAEAAGRLAERQWLYTAVTRASDRVVLAPGRRY